MRSMIVRGIMILLTGFSLSCTGIRSTLNAVGSNLGGLMRSPRPVAEKITQPFVPGARLAVLWVGHATVLIQIEDKFILTDPNLMTTVGQFSKRLVEPGIDAENLPVLDAVIISHMHIDHLSPASLDLIEEKIRQLLIPEGGMVYIPDLSFPMQELTAGQTWVQDGLRITAVPAVHNGWRYGLDGAWMKKSYTGYIIEYKGVKVHFAGDTAYDEELFRQIGREFPGIDLTLVPIAPIHPREYSRLRHTDPEEAITIYEDLRARFLTPIHFDTFPESADAPGEAEAKLLAAMAAREITGEQVIILKPGERHIYLESRSSNLSGAERPGGRAERN